ncbi:MAG: MarR family transcriptional regulator [Oscillospiraceae bacterium]
MPKRLQYMTNQLNRLEMYRRFTFHNALKESEVYVGQPPILDYLLENGNCTQKDLSNAIHVSPASMVVSIKRMQKSGLVERIADLDDLRCNRVTITKKGIEQIKEIHSIFDKLDDKLFAGFREDELEIFSAYIERLINNISKDVPSDEKVMEMIEKVICKHTQENDI